MTWYKMTCRHGPGHQSSAMRFIEAQDIKEARNRLADWRDEHRWLWEKPIVNVSRVKRFKKEEKAKLLAELYSEERWLVSEIDQVRDQIRRLEDQVAPPA